MTGTRARTAGVSAPAVRGDPPWARLLRPDGSVIVPATIAGELLRALTRDLAAQARANGGHPSPGARALLYALLEAAQHADTDSGSDVGTHQPPSTTVELTAHQVARHLGCSPEYVRRLARTGQLRARRAGRVWLIDSASFDAFRRGHPPA